MTLWHVGVECILVTTFLDACVWSPFFFLMFSWLSYFYLSQSSLCDEDFITSILIVLWSVESFPPSSLLIHKITYKWLCARVKYLFIGYNMFDFTIVWFSTKMFICQMLCLLNCFLSLLCFYVLDCESKYKLNYLIILVPVVSKYLFRYGISDHTFRFP